MNGYQIAQLLEFHRLALRISRFYLAYKVIAHYEQACTHAGEFVWRRRPLVL
jgi:hypothetical protein